MKERRCGNCAARQDSGWQLTCHRYPPPWEPVAENDWCWEWVEEPGVTVEGDEHE